MTRHLYAAFTLGLISVAVPLRAVNRPHAGKDGQNTPVWTTDDLEKLRALGLISIVGRTDELTPSSAPAPGPYVRIQDPDWYAAQAGKLRDELGRRQAQLREYRQALEDARTLWKMTSGINFDEGDVGITPQAGIEILQRRVNEAQTELDALEDLARRNGIPAGTLRGQSGSSGDLNSSGTRTE
jgi:hypothetical protein